MAEKKSYSELLRDPRWQRKRLEILNYSNFTCELCGASDKTLNVHHKRYRKGAMPWEYEADQLEALCVDCHKSHHEKKEAFNAVLARLSPDFIDRVLGYATALAELDKLDFERAHPVDLPVLSFDYARGIVDVFWERANCDRENIADCVCDHRVVDSALFEQMEIGRMPAPKTGAN